VTAAATARQAASGPKAKLVAAVVATKPGSVPATDRSVAAAPKPDDEGATKVLVATVRYDETAGEGDASPAEEAPVAATVGVAEEVSAETAAIPADVPTPRPKPAMFDSTLALRFLDAFEPNKPGFRLTVPLGYAPTGPRGAVITE
jgi:hypothetical protein